MTPLRGNCTMLTNQKSNRIRILGFAIAIVVVCFACDVRAQQVSPAKLEAITQMLQQEVDAKRIPGAVAAISYRGKVVYAEAVGYHDIESGQETVTWNLDWLRFIRSTIENTSNRWARKRFNQGSFSSLLTIGNRVNSSLVAAAYCRPRTTICDSCK